jgi:hypothetical protein
MRPRRREGRSVSVRGALRAALLWLLFLGGAGLVAYLVFPLLAAII